MKKRVFAQVRPLGVAGQEWLAGDEDAWDEVEAPSQHRVRWTCKLDDWYLTPPAGFIPLTRVVH